jgi:hypothetical protein
MKKLLLLGAIVAAFFGVKKIMTSNEEQDEFAVDDAYVNAA